MNNQRIGPIGKLLLGFVLLIALSACGEAVPDKVSLYLNGTKLEDPAVSPLVNGQLMLPAGYLAKIFDKQIEWPGDPASPKLTVDGEEVMFPGQKLSDDKQELLIPLREFCKKYDIKLDWNNSKKKVSFSIP